MLHCFTLSALLLVFVLASAAFGQDAKSENPETKTQTDFTSLFDGESLKGWEGDEKFWRAEDGVLIGQTTKDVTTKSNTFLVYNKSEYADFELRFFYRVNGGNSGVQYRSQMVGKWVVKGLQADFEDKMHEGKDEFFGMFFEENGRMFMGQRGDVVIVRSNKEEPNKPAIEKIATVGSNEELEKHIDRDGWNEYIVAWTGGPGNVEDYFTLNGKHFAIAEGEEHATVYSRIKIEPSLLKRGANKVVLRSDTKHHGIEIMLPEPTLVVRYQVADESRSEKLPSVRVESALDSSANDLDCYEQFALTHQGDAKTGAKLFSNQQTKCATCHRIGDKGGQVGPNLSSIGGKLDRPHLIDSLLYPSRQIGCGYETTIVLTENGETLSGIAKESDETHLTILDADDKRVRIAKANIEESKVSKVSIMPDGLEKSLTRQEFTDLVTYLESLGPGNGQFGNGVSGPVNVADGFQLTTVATGLSGAVAMEIAPDGRVFVCEQDGRLRIIKEGKLLEKPFLQIPVEMKRERGLIGVTLAPDFPTDPHVYVVYVTDKPYTHHRISRFRADGDVAVPDSEEILFRGDDQSKFGGHVPAGHQGGGIHFGVDGKLYVGLGEQTAGTPSQQMDALQGKILRLNPDGSIPQDNPFVNETKGKYQSIWAKGCRNPFTFAFSKTGDMLVNDVGGKFEEINRGVAGANYGWPGVDHGPTDKAGMTGPIHIYPESSINGGDFCRASSWPKMYHDMYFFADFVQGWVRFIDPDDPKTSREFVSGVRRPVDLRFAPDGSLYVLLRNAWIVDKNFVGGTSALVKISAK